MRRARWRAAATVALAAQLFWLVIGVTPAHASGGAVVTDSGCTTYSMGPSDDGTSSAVPLGFSANLFGTTYTSMYVNNNGDVTFSSAYSGFSGLDLGAFGSAIIAVAFFDVDTRGGGTTPVSWGPVTYGGRPAYCVDWVNVGYFNRGTDLRNSFQLLLVDRSDTGTGNVDIVMNYDQLAYEPAGGLTVGYSSGSTTYVSPGSGVHGALVDGNATTGLVHNSGGRYVYPVRGGQPSAPGSQTITFAQPDAVAYGSVPFTVAPTASSGLPVTLAASGACTVSGYAVTVTAVGTCTLTASQPGDGTHSAATPVTRTVTVSKGTSTVTLSGLDQTYDGTPRPVTASAAPGPGDGTLTVSYNGSGTAPTAAGTYPVTATFDSATYAGSASGTLRIARAAQTITFPAPDPAAFGDPAPALSATASSGLPVAYTATGTCTVSGATLTVTGAGQCTVTAAQDGDANHLAATPVARSFAIGKGTATIVLSGLAQTYTGDPLPVTATVSPSDAGTVTLTYDGSPTPPVHAGTYAVVATVDGTDRAGTVSGTLTVAPGAQTITFADLAPATFGDPTRALAATASSGLPIAYTATGSCAISGGRLAFTAGGSCTVTASQAGDADRAAAPDVAQQLLVGRAAQHLTVVVPLSLSVGAAPTALVASASSGLPVRVRATGVCTVDGAGLLATPHAGSCRIDATQDGDAAYLPATPVGATRAVAPAAAVLAVGGLRQTVDGTPKAVVLTVSPAGLTGVTVTYDGSAAPPSAPGTYRVVASLANPDYTAPPQTATLTLIQPPAAPVTVSQTGQLPELAPGQVLSTVDGQVSTVDISRPAEGGIALTGSGFTATLAAMDGARRAPVSSDGQLVLHRDRKVFVGATGFAANSRIDVWLFSTPLLLGTSTTDAHGNLSALLPAPTALTAGRHSLQMNGYTADGVQRSTTVGVLVADPARAPAPAKAKAPAAPLPSKVPTRADPYAALPAYVPAQHAAAVTTTTVAAFTLMTVAGAGAAVHVSGARRKSGGSVASGSSKYRRENWDGTGRGDRSSTWRWPGTDWLDRLSFGLPQRLARFSPLAARILSDAAYLRAMAGSGSLALPLAGAVLGGTAAFTSHGLALPPPPALMIALVVLGIADALAGFAAALAFAVPVVALGGAGTADSVRLLLGLCAIWFAIPLVAGAARPFRRPVPRSALDWWTRAADLVIAPLVGGWATQKVIGALSGLAGHELPIASWANRIALVAMACLAVRVVLETAASWAYPNRLLRVRPESLPGAPKLQQLLAIVPRTGLFLLLSYAFLGDVWQLWVGTALFVAPQIVSVYEDTFPNHPRLFAVLPKRIVKTVVMIFVGRYAALLLAAMVHNPERMITDGFVLLTLPGLVLAAAELFGRDGPQRERRWWRELTGGAVLAIGVGAALGLI